jgi:hypothetical protein
MQAEAAAQMGAQCVAGVTICGAKPAVCCTFLIAAKPQNADSVSV